MLAASNPALSSALAEGIPLALAASVYPPAIAVLIYYLGRDSPRRLFLAFFVGAFAMTFIVGVSGMLLLTGTDVNPKGHPAPSAGLNIALGVLLISAAHAVVRRSRNRSDVQKPARQRRTSTSSAALLGVLMYAPSLFYLSAIKKVADADPSLPAALLSALILTICVLLAVEIPVGLYLLFPDATDARLKAVNSWLRRSSPTILYWGFTLGGLYMITSGVLLLVNG